MGKVFDRRVAFDAPLEVAVGDGGREQGWAAPEVATEEFARYRYLRGGEVVIGARLQGKQPVVVTVHNTPETRQVTTEWRMRDRDDGTVFNIRSGPVPTDNRLYLEFTVESGVAV